MILEPLKKIIKPFRLISLLTTYALGLGLVQYVRELRSWLFAIQSFLFLLFLILGVEALSLLGSREKTNQVIKDLTFRQKRQVRVIIAVLGATLLTMATTFFISWMFVGALWQGWTILIIVAVLAGTLYYLTMVSPAFAPYRLFVEVLLFVIIPPALAFFVQSREFHRLLTLTVGPLAMAYMPYPLLISLKHFARDQRLYTRTIATEIGWEKTMVFHNALILLAYLLFALIALIGFPWFLLWPVFLTLPIGILEIWLVERVRRGGKPFWTVMQFATASIYFISMYLIGFAFWIR